MAQLFKKQGFAVFHRSYSIVVAVVIISLCSVVSCFRSSGQEPFIIYDDARDKRDVLALFEKNRYWLTSTPGYNMAFTMKYQTPKQDFYNSGHLKTKVLRDNSALIGFVSYFMEDTTVGKILFLAVDEQFRGKGYGGMLLRHAIHELQSMGAKRIYLVTRVENYAAQSTYKKEGFFESYRDDIYVHFDYKQ